MAVQIQNTKIYKASGIQIGENTHHQLIDITLHNFNIIKVIVSISSIPTENVFFLNLFSI